MELTYTPSSKFFISAASCVFLVGCASASNADIVFHELALASDRRQSRDKNFELPFNAYIIGVEKANQSKVGAIKECRDDPPEGDCINIRSGYLSNNKKLQSQLRAIYANQHRPTFVSHLAKFTEGTTSGTCFIYNLYDRSRMCSSRFTGDWRDSDLVSLSWRVMQELEGLISKDIEAIKPTHFVIYIMGWNTPQWEAMKNYRDLFHSLNAAAKEGGAVFRPLYFGVTWPSTGDPLVSGSDYGIKAKDADEVGLVWGNILINRVLAGLRQKHKIPTVVVGHSFGARASSRAAFSAPVIASESPTRNVDLLLGLQGAYSYQRYLPSGGQEGSPYADYSKMVGKVVLTSSIYDTAVTQAGHKDYFVGSNSVFEVTKQPQYMQYFEHSVTNKDGRPDRVSCDSSKVMMIDASTVVNKNQPGTGGGAHSFIYGPEIGRLTFEYIAQCLGSAK